jgi:hypothetical protein
MITGEEAREEYELFQKLRTLTDGNMLVVSPETRAVLVRERLEEMETLLTQRRELRLLRMRA